MEIDEINEDILNDINKNIQNDSSNIKSLKGFEIICESMVYKILDIFGKNSLLSMLYQTGSGPGEVIAKRIKEKYNKEEFGIFEALEILMTELKDFYSIQIREVQLNSDQTRVVIENFCFLREASKRREKLQPGKAFCRVNKGYFETAFRKLLGNKVKKIEINFLQDAPEKNVCVEELIFYHNTDKV